jgi:Protein of unknown function (DUF2798)
MMGKIPYRYKNQLFALVMSMFTSCIVSGVISLIFRPWNRQLFGVWGKSFVMAWPVVFVAILIIAPPVMAFVERVTEQPGK